MIELDSFKALSSFPRYPENKDLCVDITTIDRSESLVVFISHCWLRGWSGADGWDGRPHPDNANADKFKLCVEGIEKTKKILAPGARQCYIWLDFGCMDQDGNPAGELKQLDEIMRNADCIFTPIFGEDRTPRGVGIYNWYDDYLAAAWNEGPYSYTQRGWCRVEMFYAANIPVLDDRLRAERCFQHGFKVHVLNGVRPHLLYGTSESKQLRAPIILPPMQNSFYDQLDPLKGNLTVLSDRAKIHELYESLRPYFKTVSKVGYEDSFESNGKRSGKGIHRGDDGGIYDGEWLDGLKHGLGVYRMASGTVYEGEYRTDKKSGHGIYRHVDGDIYEGGYLNNVQSGYGIYRFASGHVYEGGCTNGLMSGYGIMRYPDGRVYEGQYLNGKGSGHGVLRGADGTIIKEGRYLYDEYVGK